MAEKGRLHTGPRARFKLNNKVIAYATDVSFSENITFEPIKILDSIEIEEHVPVDYEVTGFSCRKFRPVGETLKGSGLFPKLGNTPGDHLLNILNAGEMTATIEDTRTGRVIATLEGVKIASQDMQVQARQVTSGNVQFVAKRVKDEFEVGAPPITA